MEVAPPSVPPVLPGPAAHRPLAAARAAGLALLLAGAAACGTDGERTATATATTPTIVPEPVAAPAAPSVRGARWAAEKYVRAVARGDGRRAGEFAGRPTAHGRASLRRLARWLGAVPSARVRVDGTAALERRDAGGTVFVRVTLSARLGPGPLTSWLALGAPVVAVRHDGDRWGVVASRPDGGEGLHALGMPRVRTGRAVTVVHPADVAADVAAELLAVGEAEWPALRDRWGAPRNERAVMIVVPSQRAAEGLTGESFVGGPPIAWHEGGEVYVVLRRHAVSDALERASTVVHELTHAASRHLLADAPLSLWEGLAVFEEDRYFDRHGYYLVLSDRPTPSPAGRMALWSSNEDEWGLGTGGDVAAAYDDAGATVIAIVERYGEDGVRRLARAFARGDGWHTERTVKRAFPIGLGASFDELGQAAAAVRSRR
jgi:hypothetical protein